MAVLFKEPVNSCSGRVGMLAGGRQANKTQRGGKNSERGKTFSEETLLGGENELGQVRSLGVANSSVLGGWKPL